MPNCRKNILYTPDLAKMPCLARTHCDTCTSYTDGKEQADFSDDDCPDDKFGIKGQILDGSFDEDKEGIVNLDCCNNTCNTCNTHDCCCVDPVRPKKCCANPCIDGALPLLTKCGLKYKKQLQHGLTLVNPCQVFYPNPCVKLDEDGNIVPHDDGNVKNIDNNGNVIDTVVGGKVTVPRQSRQVKSYNKKYSFNDQLLLLKSNAFAKSANTYNCNRWVKERVKNDQTGEYYTQTTCKKQTPCPTNNCF